MKTIKWQHRAPYSHMCCTYETQYILLCKHVTSTSTDCHFIRLQLLIVRMHRLYYTSPSLANVFNSFKNYERKEKNAKFVA